MNEIDKIGLKAELFEEVCGLNHGPVSNKPKAVDWLVLPLGQKQSEVVATQTEELVIPICAECAEEFNKLESEWVLLYCLDCNESQWVLRELSRLSWINKATMQLHKVLWLRGCPRCTNKFGGVWFS